MVLTTYTYQFAGIKTKDPCNFDNLNLLVFVCHCALPLIAIPLTFVLIPDKKMTDKIIDDDGGSFHEVSSEF